MELARQLISVRAYQMWEQEGRPHGRDQAHWFEAERQLQNSESAVPMDLRSTSNAHVTSPPARRGRKRQ
jgi:DUF2934 family protein